MFATNKRLRIGTALAAGVSVVLLVSYYSLSRARSRQAATPRTPAGSKETERRKSISLDIDNDGLPELAEIQSFADRDHFRRTFTGIAEMQFYRLSDQWNVEQRDCSGLVRFAWREALRLHDRAWFKRMDPGYEQLVTDASLRPEKSPLGDKIFRTDFGSYREGDLASGKFSKFADARTLKNFNAVFFGRDRRLAQPGDLLFYHQPWVQKYPYHVMIFVGPSQLDDSGAHDWVVYHTGATSTDEGLVKKVELSVLDQHPSKRWRPVEDNPNFLGFYRLKILD